MNYKKSVTGIALLAFLVPSFVFAHEHQDFTIGGKNYEFVVGSLGEPVVVDDKTGLDLRVTSGGTPVEGLEKTLKLEIIAGEKKKTFDISTVWGTLGSYKTLFYPTIQTTLTYRIFGTINDVAVDLSFTCNPAGHVASPEDKTPVPVSSGVVRTLKSGQFGCPQSKAELGFPEASLSLHDIDEDVDGHVASLMGSIEKTNGLAVASLALLLLGTMTGVVLLWKYRKPVR